MPIKGLTTQREPSFPRIGVLRKGGEMTKTADGRTKPGQDLHWFRFDTDDADAVKDFSTAYGAEPTTINVYLPYITPDENFQAWKEEYSAGGIVHRCDGETMSVHLLPDGKYSTIAKPCPYHAGTVQRTAKNPGCKAVGRLMVIVPELRRFAYVTVLTTSVNDIMELTDNLNAIYAMRGSLQGVPLILCRRPRFISTPTPDGKRARYEKWMLSVEVNPAWAQMQLENMSRVAYLPVDRLLLTDSGTVDTDTGEIIDAEPQPATQGKATPPPEPQITVLASHGNGAPAITQVRASQPVTTVTEPEAVTNPFNDFATATDEELGIIGAWGSPPMAQEWVIKNGLATNEFSARNAWLSAVKSCGGYSNQNAAQVKLAYLRERRAKHGAPSVAELAAVPEMAH